MKIKKLLPACFFLISVLCFHTGGTAQCRLELSTPAHDCVPATSTFKREDNSGKKITSVKWDFGDTATATDLNTVLSHTYKKSGSFSVKIVVSYADGTTCTATSPIKIRIFDPPKPVINLPSTFPYGTTQCFYRNGVLNHFSFTESSVTGSGAPITKYYWNFGDGTTSLERNPTHSYQATGQYSVTLTVTDSNGCSGVVRAKVPLIVLKEVKPHFTFMTLQGCNSAKYTFTSDGDTTGTSVGNFLWDFGDGSIDTKNVNPVHEFGPGKFLVRHYVNSKMGCGLTDSTWIIMVPFVPNVSFKDTVCWADARDNGVIFSNVVVPNVISYDWDFGDPASGAANQAKLQWKVTHKFASGPGNYKVRFKMVNANAACGTRDTCVTVHIKGPMAMINLPAPTYAANNYVAAHPMSKTDFSAINNNPVSCGPQTISYATFTYQKNIRHVKYKYCKAPVLSKTTDTLMDCYGGHRLPYVTSVTLKPTDSIISIYTDSTEVLNTWIKGDKLPTGQVYYPSQGKLVWNNMHDSNLATCKLPNLVRFTNNSVKYRLRRQLDDNTYLNVSDPAHSYRDTCTWTNYPMASDSLQYFWKFNDPSGNPCTSSLSNKDWNCNFSTLAVPYHYYKGLKGMPADGIQKVELLVKDAVTNCSDVAVLFLKQSAPSAYWDRKAYCKMNWDMQQSFLAPTGSGTPRLGFQLSGQPGPCNGVAYPFKIDFSQNLPSGGAQHWWITFDSAHTTTVKKCASSSSTFLDYGFMGDPALGYSPGKNNYPAAGPAAYWAGMPWAGNYWYQNGDTGCKTIGIVMQNGHCYDTAWYHDYICINNLEPYFKIYAVDSGWACGSTGDFRKDNIDSISIARVYGPNDPARPKSLCAGQYAYAVNNQRFIDNSKTSGHGHISQSHPSAGSEGARVRLFPDQAEQRDVVSFAYTLSRKPYYADPDNKNSTWYYNLPFWPDSAELYPFSNWADTVRQVKNNIYYIDTPYLYTLINVPGLPSHKVLANFPLYQYEIDSLYKTLLAGPNHFGYVNISSTDPRAKKISTICGKPFITLYASKIAIRNRSQTLELKGFGAVDSLTLPYPGFYTITAVASNLQGCSQASTYQLIYGHFATFNARNDSIVCLGQKVDFDYYVRYWSTHCPQPKGGGPAPEGCLNGYDEDANGNIPNTLDFAPWDSVNPLAYRMAITGGKFKAPDNLPYQNEQILWNFGDDNMFHKSINGLRPSHTYTKPGAYTVTMRTIDWRGCVVNTVRQNLIKVIQPVVDFKLADPKDSANNCGPVRVHFMAETKILGASYHQKVLKYGLIRDSVFVVDSVAKYEWSPGDGTKITTGANDTFSVVYNTVGSFNVTLAMQTNHGCADIKTKSNFVAVRHLAPNGHWAYTLDNKAKAVFTNDDVHNASYTWDFGDGGKANTPSPIHIYTSNGTYVVTCTTTSTQGCQAMMTDTVKVTTLTGMAPGTESLANLAIYPNPFRGATTVSYSLTKQATTRILVFDITGKEIASLIQEKQLPGSYQTDINAEKYHLHPGIYLLKFMVDDQVASKQIVYSGN